MVLLLVLSLLELSFAQPLTVNIRPLCGAISQTLTNVAFGTCVNVTTSTTLVFATFKSWFVNPSGGVPEQLKLYAETFTTSDCSGPFLFTNAFKNSSSASDCDFFNVGADAIGVTVFGPQTVAIGQVPYKIQEHLPNSTSCGGGVEQDAMFVSNRCSEGCSNLSPGSRKVKCTQTKQTSVSNAVSVLRHQSRTCGTNTLVQEERYQANVCINPQLYTGIMGSLRLSCSGTTVTVSTYNDTNCAIAKDTMIYPPPGSYESATCVSHSGAIVVGFIFLCPGQVTTTTTMTTLPSTTRTTVPTTTAALTATTAVTATTRPSHADRAAAYWLLCVFLLILL